MSVRRQGGVGEGRAADRRERTGQIVWQNSASPRLRGDKPAPGLGAEMKETEMNGKKFLKIGNRIINPDHIVDALLYPSGQETTLVITLSAIEDTDNNGASCSQTVKFSNERALAVWKVLEEESYVVVT